MNKRRLSTYITTENFLQHLWQSVMFSFSFLITLRNTQKHIGNVQPAASTIPISKAE